MAAPKYWVGICAEYTDNFEGPLFDRHLEVYAYVNDSVKLTTTNSPKEAHKFRSQDAAIKCIEQKFEKKLEGTAKKAVLIEV